MRMAPGLCAWLCLAERWSLVFGQECLLYLRCERPFRWPTSFRFSSLVSSREWLFLVGATEWAGEGGREHSWGLYKARRPGRGVAWEFLSVSRFGRLFWGYAHEPHALRVLFFMRMAAPFYAHKSRVLCAWP